MSTFERMEIIKEIKAQAATLQVAGTEPGEYRMTVLDRLEGQSDLQLVTLRDGLAVMAEG